MEEHTRKVKLPRNKRLWVELLRYCESKASYNIVAEVHREPHAEISVEPPWVVQAWLLVAVTYAPHVRTGVRSCYC